MSPRGGSDLIILSYDAALKLIAERAAQGVTLENWEGWVKLRDGTRTKSLDIQGSFALSRDPARAADAAKAGIEKARAQWERRPEHPGAELLIGLSFGESPK